MWSQYADGHRGLCYELNYAAIESEVQAKNSAVSDRKVILFDRVTYCKPSEFKVASEGVVVGELSDGSPVARHEEIVMLKINTFAYEEEIRLATKSLDTRETLPVPNLVAGVYMGLEMPEKNREMLGKIVDMVNKMQGRSIKKYIAKAFDDSYRVKFEEIG
jgi:hypothetical protein